MGIAMTKLWEDPATPSNNKASDNQPVDSSTPPVDSSTTTPESSTIEVGDIRKLIQELEDEPKPTSWYIAQQLQRILNCFPRHYQVMVTGYYTNDDIANASLKEASSGRMYDVTIKRVQ